jgi:tRNA(Ile)-lysidine synthase TilS/MesJ
MFFGFLLVHPNDHLTDNRTRYAYFKKLDYFSTECIYSPDAYRGHARAFLKDLEAARPSAIIDIIHSGEAFEIKEEIKATQKVQRKHATSLLRRKGLLSYLIFYLQKLARGVGTCPAMNCVKLARY